MKDHPLTPVAFSEEDVVYKKTNKKDNPFSKRNIPFEPNEITKNTPIQQHSEEKKYDLTDVISYGIDDPDIFITLHI